MGNMETTPKAIVTVILPCAGEGSRLGLKRPKELYEVEPGKPMIGYSLDLIRSVAELMHAPVRVVVVMRQGKESVVESVETALKPAGVEVVSVQFDEKLSEWPGSIHSAREFFSDKNVVLLPDSYIETGGRLLIAEMLEALQHHSLVMGAKQSTDPAEIRRLGALRLSDTGSGEAVLEFADKPEDASRFDAIWGCFAFRGEIAEELHEFLMCSVLHFENHYGKRSFYPAGTVLFEDYFDLGTWEQIELFREKREAMREN